MSKILLLLTISCYLLNGVELSKFNDQLTEEEVKSLNYLMTSINNKTTKLNTTNNLQLDTEKSVSIITSMKIYYEKYCQPKQGPTFATYLTGTINDNKITYTETIGKEFTGLITISPDPNLQGFNIDFGFSDYTNGFQMHFSDNNMKCKTNDGVYEIPNFKGEVCVLSYNLKRASGGTVKACFVIGGALLTSKYYDINTINSFNAMSAAVIDFGCYSATNTDITQYSDNDSDTKLKAALGAIVTPLHARLCNSATRTLPLLIPVFILTFKSILSY